MKVGYGFDVHAFKGGRPLMLGGVQVPHDTGLGGHSDGDVLCHAIADAILGAGALGDIGEHFPSADQKWRDAPSVDFIRQAVQMARTIWMRVVQLDATVVCEEPMIAPYRDQMRAAIADAVMLKVEDVSVKATTSDGLGFTGRGEGIAAFAVAVLEDTGL